MNDIKVTVGGSIEEDAARRFADAWHRAERGESYRERHLAFESWDALARAAVVRRRIAEEVARLDKADEAAALAWIEAVSEFDNGSSG